jgi:formylmethanofuran dehydrogenase subunit E
VQKPSMAKKLNLQKVIDRCNDIFDNKYDYSQSVFVNTRTPMNIICPIHGKFSMPPKRHLKGRGCPECGKEYARNWRKKQYKAFVNESTKRFGIHYKFLNIENEYINSHSKITIQCTKCGNIFTKIACDHLTSPYGGCHHCYSRSSSAEFQIGNYIKMLIGDDKIIFGDRKTLHGLELDIFVPSRKIAIEYNGLHYHNEQTKDKFYHLNKTEMCEKNNITLIHIFEDEWEHKRKTVLKYLRDIFDISNRNLFDYKNIDVQPIDYNVSKEFLDINHIDGGSRATVYLGAFINGQIIGVTNFIKNKDAWFISRFSTNHSILSSFIAQSTINYFIKKYSNPTLFVKLDRRWYNINKNIFSTLGYKALKVLPPSYKFYLNGETIRYTKYFIKHKPCNTYTPLKIWDCGYIKYQIN